MAEGLKNLNKVILIGRLTHTPELKYTPKGAAVTRFCIAVNTRRRNKIEETLFIDVVAWNKLAEFCAQYFKKGKGIYVEGSLTMHKWQSKEDNSQRTKIEVLAEKISFLDTFGAIDENSESVKNTGTADNVQPLTAAENSGDIVDGEEEDIPF